MAERPAPSQRPVEPAQAPDHAVRRPVVAGLTALTSVAVVAGLLGGVIVIAGTKIFGVSETDGGGTGAPSAGETLFLPDPVKTSSPSGPKVSLDVDPLDLTVDEDAEPEEEEEKDAELTLTAGQSSVAPMGRIDLSGSYGTDGAILQVQRRVDGGDWTDFPVTVPVRGGTFSTYLMTGQVGRTDFRVVDTDSDTKSKPVTVQIG